MDALLSLLCAYVVFMFVVLPVVGTLLGAVTELCKPIIYLYRRVSQ